MESFSDDAVESGSRRLMVFNQIDLQGGNLNWVELKLHPYIQTLVHSRGEPSGSPERK